MSNVQQNVFELLKQVAIILKIPPDSTQNEKDVITAIYEHYQKNEWSENCSSKETSGENKRKTSFESHGVITKKMKDITKKYPIDKYPHSVLPLNRLPDTAMTIVLKYLKLRDRKCMRLLSKWFDGKVTALSPSTRKWNIAITEQNFQEIQNTLDRTKENMNVTNNSSRYHLHISLNNHRHHKFIPDHSFREKVLTWLAEEWSTHLDSLSFTVYNDEGFLFDNKFTFPNLEHLCIGQSRKNTYSFLNSFDHALEMHGCQVRETLICRHASSLQYLEVHGNWKLDLGGRKLAAVHTISMTQPTTQSFNQLINQCDESLQTVIVKAAQDEYIYDETDTLMPNIVNIYIDSSWTSWYRLIVAYAGQLTALKISSDDYALLDIGVQLPKLKTLCVRNETHGMHIVSLLEKCVDSLECLIVDRFNFEPVHLPKLTDLYVLKREIEEAGDPSNLFHLLQINKQSLQFLFVSDNKPSLFNDTGIEDLSGQLTNLQTILLPGCVNDQLITICQRQLRSGYLPRVLTFREEVNEEVSRRSQKSYSNLAPYIKHDYNVQFLSYYYSSK